MLILNGKNLGERQKELNKKVNEAAAKNVDFEEIKDKPEKSDVDKLFKIDLASKYMDIKYFMEVLKSGDSLYISRALKCAWMFEDDFSMTISVDYLHHNVFPFMSQKMKRKFLTAASTHIRNADRALAFYNYCTEMKLTNIALKFVNYTSNAYKLEFIKKNTSELFELRYKNDLKYFIGGSFTLADAYIATLNSETIKMEVFNEIIYLYSVSDVKYLDMFEKHVGCMRWDMPKDMHWHNYSSYMGIANNTNRVGLRISKDVLKKHKDRVEKYPSGYINFLNKTSIVKYSTPESAKIYATALLPQEVDDFWNANFCDLYKYILDILPPEERFVFIKKIFTEKYPDQPFESTNKFYQLRYFQFMTAEQKDKWALEQIANQNEIFGTGNEYKWYKYVNFETAFKEVKKMVMITPDNKKRCDIVEVLVESAKTQRDLEKLFKYYHDRHNNELRPMKENLMYRVANVHNVYKFDKDCWEAFNKIYQNLDVYNMFDYNTCRSEFKVVALIYNIINDMEVHDALKLYISTNVYFYILKLNTDKLSKEQQEKVYKYLFKFYMEKIYEFDSVPYSDDMKYQLRKFIYFVLDLLHQHDRTKEDIPEVVTKFMKLDWEEFRCHKLHYEQPKRTTQDDLIRYLKKDAKLVVENLPVVKKNIEVDYTFYVGQLLKKIKIYFSNDILKDYLKFYNELLTSEKLCSKVALAACYGIFQLGDDRLKVDFMTKHAPTESKVNRSEIDEKLLNVQEAICATALYSRPPVPLKNMLMYVKGDYVKKCLPLFNSYFANLPPPLCMEFIEAILNNPLSVQKHGLRLAFVCYNAENLSKLVLYIWKKTKNISLRLIIYKALYNKIVDKTQNAQTALFETLIKITLELNQDDDNEVYSLLISRSLPEHFMSDYVNAVWTAVSALPESNINLERKTSVVRYINSNITSIRQSIIRTIVDEFVKDVFNTQESIKAGLETTSLNESKWDLTVNHITYVKNKDDLDIKLELTKRILNACLAEFKLVHINTYIVRKFSNRFIRKLLDVSICQNVESWEYLNVIFETVLQIFQESLSTEDIYLIMWSIPINIATRKAIREIDTKLTNIEDKNEKAVKGAILTFGNDIGCLIKQFIEKDLYVNALLPNIHKEVIDKMYNVVSRIHHVDIKADDLLVIVSVALMEFKMTEMYLFALNIVPSDYSRQYGEDYNTVLTEIRELNNTEIRCKLYDKFVNNDFTARAFLQM